MRDSLSDGYADRLRKNSGTLWKRVLNVQAPYAWNLRRLDPGYLLDVGCGLGRNLAHVHGRGLGVDPNRACVAACREAGLQADTPDEFFARAAKSGVEYDSVLFSHVLEHMSPDAARELVQQYLPFLRPAGQIIFITPQEAGYRSDPTHVSFVDAERLRALAEGFGLEVTRSYSFPFPRAMGRYFKYNEFVVTARRS